VRLRADERSDAEVELALADGGRTVPILVEGYGLSTIRLSGM
jgi:hypothetical protein